MLKLLSTVNITGGIIRLACDFLTQLSVLAVKCFPSQANLSYICCFNILVWVMTWLLKMLGFIIRFFNLLQRKTAKRWSELLRCRSWWWSCRGMRSWKTTFIREEDLKNLSYKVIITKQIYRKLENKLNKLEMIYDKSK